jgi:hypothetical protein
MDLLKEQNNKTEKKEALFFSENEKKLEKRLANVANYIETHDFDSLMLRLVNEHNEDYRESCYINGLEPYPNNKLQLVLDYIAEIIEPVNDIKGLDYDFPCDVYYFKGYYFQHIYGQGTITRIINKDDMKIILQI